MKKLYSTIMMLAMMVAALSLTACGGDDNDSENVSIVGVWECVSYERSEGLFESSTLKVGDYLYLNADKTYSMQKGGTSDVFDKGKWMLTDNQLMVDSDYPNIMTASFSVLKLNSSTLSLTWNGFITLSFRRVEN